MPCVAAIYGMTLRACAIELVNYRHNIHFRIDLMELRNWEICCDFGAYNIATSLVDDAWGLIERPRPCLQAFELREELCATYAVVYTPRCVCKWNLKLVTKRHVEPNQLHKALPTIGLCSFVVPKERMSHISSRKLPSTCMKASQDRSEVSIS